MNSVYDYFIYAGYAFPSEQERIHARESFKDMSRKIKASLGLSMDSELKAAGLEIKHKRSLYNCVRFFDSLSQPVHHPPGDLRDQLLLRHGLQLRQ